MEELKIRFYHHFHYIKLFHLIHLLYNEHQQLYHQLVVYLNDLSANLNKREVCYEKISF
jgi:hypothetical protein